MELIKVIAMICSISAGTSYQNRDFFEIVENKQKECHKYYVNCYFSKKSILRENFLKCIMERK